MLLAVGTIIYLGCTPLVVNIKIVYYLNTRQLYIKLRLTILNVVNLVETSLYPVISPVTAHQAFTLCVHVCVVCVCSVCVVCMCAYVRDCNCYINKNCAGCNQTVQKLTFAESYQFKYNLTVHTINEGNV